MDFGNFILPRPTHGLIGHRGLAGHAPENTFASMKLAKDMGIHWIEIDIRLAKNGEIVVFHDATLERTTNGKGRVSAKDLTTLKDLDAGLWFGSRFEGEKIPTLSEALAFILSIDLKVNIEVKCPANTPVAKMKAFADAVWLTLQKDWPKHLELPLVSSFHLGFLLYLREIAPLIPIGVLTDKLTPSTIALVKKLKNCSLHCGKRHLTQAIVQDIYQMKIPLLVYTINERDLGLSLLKAGAFALFSDTPEIFLAK